MKLKFLLAVATVFGASLSVFADGTVSSINAAGYIKVDTEGGKFYFLQTPFTKFDNTSTYKVSEVMGSNVPFGTTLFIWDGVNQTYKLSAFVGVWSPDEDIERGQGFFVQSPNGSPLQSIFLHGQVPGAQTYSTTDISVGQGFNAIGWPYPTKVTLEDSGISSVMGFGDTVFVWNDALQNYELIAWFGTQFSTENYEVKPGSAVFLQIAAAGQQTFSPVVPYAWPNN